MVCQLLKAVVEGSRISVSDYRRATAAFAAAKPGKFESNLLCGFSAALVSVATKIQFLMIKAKPNKDFGVAPQPSTDLELSWVLAGVTFGFGQDPDASVDADGDAASGGGGSKDGAPSLPPPTNSDEHGTVVVGVTGGIAAGKSTLMAYLRDKGHPTVDADKLGHRAYTQGTGCYNDIVREFGDSIVADDGSINRRQLGSIVFSAKDRMRALCDITWPHIRRHIEEEVATLKASAAANGTALPFIFVEAAVLIEAGWMDVFDEVWVITVPEEVACSRLMKRNSLDRDEALKRIRAQLSNDERVRHATRVFPYSDADADDAGTALNERVAKIMSDILQSK